MKISILEEQNCNIFFFIVWFKTKSLKLNFLLLFLLHSLIICFHEQNVDYEKLA